jgi:hypothetical protein
LYTKKTNQKQIVISSEIGITCDRLGRFTATDSAIKLDVKAPLKEKKENKKM